MSQPDVFLRERHFLPYSVKLQHCFINCDVVYVKDPRTIPGLETLLKYILLGTFLKHEDSFISDVLHIYETRFGEQWTLNPVYKLMNAKKHDSFSLENYVVITYKRNSSLERGISSATLCSVALMYVLLFFRLSFFSLPSSPPLALQ